MSATLKGARPGSDTWGTIASGLAEKLTAWGQPAAPALIERALRDLLDGQDQSTKQLRAALQTHLAIVSNGSPAYAAADAGNDDMLSTEQAAQLMGCSRPYVAMLIDANKLAGGMKSKGGHRKVPKSSVLQWIKNTKAARENSADNESYRKAAADAGMYAIPDEDYLRAAKNGP